MPNAFNTWWIMEYFNYSICIITSVKSVCPKLKEHGQSSLLNDKREWPGFHSNWHFSIFSSIFQNENLIKFLPSQSLLFPACLHTTLTTFQFGLFFHVEMGWGAEHNKAALSVHCSLNALSSSVRTQSTQQQIISTQWRSLQLWC